MRTKYPNTFSHRPTNQHHQSKRLLGEAAKRWRSVLLLIQCILLTACSDGNTLPTQQVIGGEATQGKQLVRHYGCASCHVIPGLQTVESHFGPSLNAFGKHPDIAGELPNQPDNLMRWLQSPQSVKPGTAMPNLGIDDIEAKHIAAFLYTLR